MALYIYIYIYRYIDSGFGWLCSKYTAKASTKKVSTALQKDYVDTYTYTDRHIPILLISIYREGNPKNLYYC